MLRCQPASIGNPMLKVPSAFFRRDVKVLLMGDRRAPLEATVIAVVQETLAAARPKR